MANGRPVLERGKKLFIVCAATLGPWLRRADELFGLLKLTAVFASVNDDNFVGEANFLVTTLRLPDSREVFCCF